MPELDRLARATHETTGLGVLDGDQLLTVAQADGPNLVAVGDWTGRCVPLHCVAAGKVLMAALAEREILRLVRRGLDQFTDRTITDLEPLLEELARVRRRGYATAIGEYDPGLNAVAAPVHDARGQVIAAVDVWGPAFRLTPRRIPELAQQVREAAAAVSVRLGGTAAWPRPRRAAWGSPLRLARMDLTAGAPSRRQTSSTCAARPGRCRSCLIVGHRGSSLIRLRAARSSTASSRRCSTARRPRAPPRSCPRSRSGSGWTRSRRWAPRHPRCSSSSSRASMILGELDLDIGPAIAGLGVVGIAVGFGTQSLVRDYFTGALILIENQFAKGDVVTIAGVTGTVEDFSLRRTTLRDLDGVVHTVPNGEIKVASNRTRVWARINLDVTVAYGTDIEEATARRQRRGPGDGRGSRVAAAGARGAARRADRGARRVRRHAQGPGPASGRPSSGPRAASCASACSAAFARTGIEIPRPQRVVLARDPEPDPFAPGGPASPAPTQDDLSAGTD